MALATVYSRAESGMQAPEVAAEIHVGRGLPALTIVGMVETAVRESRERVKAAILEAGFEFPDRRVTVNLAPADLPKAGGRFDLAIAIGILAATRQLEAEPVARLEFFGELALSGGLRAVPGLLPALLAASQAGRRCVVPAANGGEASLPDEAPALLAAHLLEVVEHLRGRRELPAAAAGRAPEDEPGRSAFDLADVRGQFRARRALEIAAAGGHHSLFVGPPGTGKTMLARRLPGLLPALDRQGAVEAAVLRSLPGCLSPASTAGRPGARHTIRLPRRPWSAAGARRVPGKSRWLIAACCFSTSCRSSRASRSRRCASRSKAAGSRWRGRAARTAFRRHSSWSPP